MPTKNEIKQQLAESLRVSPEKLDARIIGLKIGPTCDRCGGSGNYSWNATDGSKCYGCNGTGQKAPRTKAELEATLERAKDVDVDAYLVGLRAAHNAQAIRDEAFALWGQSKASALYEYKSLFVRLHGEPQRVYEAVAAVNKQMCNHVKRITDLRGQMIRADVASKIELGQQMMALLEEARENFDRWDVAYSDDIIARYKAACDHALESHRNQLRQQRQS